MSNNTENTTVKEALKKVYQRLEARNNPLKNISGGNMSKSFDDAKVLSSVQDGAEAVKPISMLKVYAQEFGKSLAQGQGVSIDPKIGAKVAQAAEIENKSSLIKAAVLKKSHVLD